MALREDGRSDLSQQLESRPPTRRNFLVLAFYNVILRVGWIFKTESIIMPAIVDSIGGAGWLRGCLPMLNRLGQSVPPVLLADWVRNTPLKQRVLRGSSLLMGGSFLFLALVWWWLAGQHPVWLPFLFLLVYGFFWFCVGVHNLCFSLLNGKLVGVTSRGQLMLVATTIGSAVAVACAWFLMRPWLAGPSADFLWMFLFTGAAFVLASLFSCLLVEQPDMPSEQPQPIRHSLTLISSIVSQDANFRRLAMVAACYAISITLFPHYQAYLRQNLDLGLESFVPWLIAQNIGAAFFSIPLGKIADRFGNRLAIRATMLLLSVAPALTIGWSYVGGSEVGFYLVFFLLGLTPVTMRTFSNYTLEIVEADRQPIYLSTLGACMAVPVVMLSAVIGWLIDVVGFEPIFLMVVAVLLLGWALTFGLHEPRSDKLDQTESSA